MASSISSINLVIDLCQRDWNGSGGSLIRHNTGLLDGASHVSSEVRSGTRYSRYSILIGEIRENGIKGPSLPNAL